MVSDDGSVGEHLDVQFRKFCSTTAVRSYIILMV